MSASVRSVMFGPMTPAGPIMSVMRLWGALVDVFKLSLQRVRFARETSMNVKMQCQFVVNTQTVLTSLGVTSVHAGVDLIPQIKTVL
ncbi:hypothetical protein F2P79_003931 [Pimephales promelas]|nr:hypothetical protein F2P79_003931 [Pimephales promelas]